MVDPRVYPPTTDIDLADVVRRFGPQYIARYGPRMLPSQKKANWEAGSTAATTARRRSGTTTAAATGPVPNAMPARPASGSRSDRMNCCPVIPFTSS
jgi:hypothetical protein